MKIIVGLGNPGEKYTHTRHNIGFRIIDALAELWKAPSTSCSQFKAEATEVHIDGEKILLIKPMTFMNLSGESVQQFVNYYKVDPQKDVLIIFDDKDLLFGSLRHREAGSAGGHNGIKSLIQQLGTDQFHRLKFGVGHENQKIPTDAFVLQKFSEEEEEELQDLIQEALKKTQDWLKSS